jgi:cytochrome c-type biogenesis protein CcmH/NrfG
MRQAIESSPGFIKAYLNLGELLASQSRYSDASAVVERALQIAPANRQLQNLHDRLKAHGTQ